MKNFRYLTAVLAAFAGLIAVTTINANAALVAHYEFEETTGTTLVDSTSNNFNGTLQGTGDLDVAGKFGSGYDPNNDAGDGNYGQIAGGVSSFGIAGNNARSISLWFNTPDTGVGTSRQDRLFGMGDGAASSFDLTYENQEIGIRYGNGNIFFDSDNSGTAFSINTWYHVAVVYDGTTMDLETGVADGTGLLVYVNGTQVNENGTGNLNNATQALTTSLTDIALGAKFDGSLSSGAALGYAGLLDDVRFYDSALTSSEVSALAAIPEPSTFALVGLGLGALFLLRRRQ